MCPLCTNAVHSTTIKLPYKHEVEGSKPSHDGIFMVAQGKSAYKQRCVFFCAVVCLLRVARTSCRTDFVSHGLVARTSWRAILEFPSVVSIFYASFLY